MVSGIIYGFLALLVVGFVSGLTGIHYRRSRGRWFPWTIGLIAFLVMMRCAPNLDGPDGDDGYDRFKAYEQKHGK